MFDVSASSRQTMLWLNDLSVDPTTLKDLLPVQFDFPKYDPSDDTHVSKTELGDENDF